MIAFKMALLFVIAVTFTGCRRGDFKAYTLSKQNGKTGYRTQVHFFKYDESIALLLPAGSVTGFVIKISNVSSADIESVHLVLDNQWRADIENIRCTITNQTFPGVHTYKYNKRSIEKHSDMVFQFCVDIPNNIVFKNNEGKIMLRDPAPRQLSIIYVGGTDEWELVFDKEVKGLRKQTCNPFFEPFWRLF